MRFSTVEGTERNHVVLEKGNETTFVESQNDAEFFEYIHHFERFKDEFGNYQFMYVEDINGYKHKIEELIKQGTVPKRPYQITIGEFIIGSPFLYYLVIPRYGGAHLGQAYFFVNIVKNPDFLKIDYRDPVKIKWLDSNELAFNGYAHEVNVSENSALFLCTGGPRRISESRLNSELIGLTPQDAIYFTASSANMNMVFDGGPKPLLVKRAFTVIFPVSGLNLPSEFTIENVLFTNNINRFLNDRIKGSQTIRNYPWKVATSFAVVQVIAEHYKESFTKAEEVAKRAVDWIQFRTDISLPSITDEGKTIMLSYNMSKAFSKCSVILYGLAIDSATNGSIFNLLNVQSGHPLVFHHSPQDFFDPLIPTLDKLSHLNLRYSESVQPLYETLSWLMQSFEVESLVDNLLQLWIAFEFICTNEKGTKLVADTSIDASVIAVQSLNLPEADKSALVESVKRVNDPPLMVKWQALLRRLNVLLTTEEQQLIRKLRTERNNLIHGKKSCKLTIDDLDKFRSILERIFIKKASVLIESHYGIQKLSFIFEH